MKFSKKIFYLSMILALFICFSPLIPVNAASSCTVNYNTTFQKIDGFGCTTAFHAARNLMNFSEPARTQVCDLLWSPTTGAGLSILRNMVGDSGTWGSNIDGPNSSIEPSEGVWNWTGDEDQIWAMNQAKNRGCITFFSTVWSPPAWMKTNNSVINGGELRTDKYQQFADYLAEYVNGYKSHHGIDIMGIGISNEPGLSTSYSSCLWNSTQLKNFIGTYLKPTFQSKNVPAKVIACDEMTFSDSRIAEALNDSTASGRIDIVSAHAYGGDGYSPLTTANSKGKTVWMTEWIDSGSLDSTITGGIRTIKLLHNQLTNANVSAWLYMYGPGKSPTSNSSLICLDLNNNSSYEVRKRLWTIGNYSRYVRPGSYRISATSSPTSNVFVSAFKETASGKLVIVAINDNSSTQDINFTIQNYTTNSVTPYRTSATENLAQLSNIGTSGGNFTAILASKSVTTFVAYSGGTSPTPTPTLTPTATPSPRFSPTPSAATTPTPTRRGNPTPTPTPVSGNLITNPGMETGNTSGWTVNGAGSIAVSTAQKHSGTYSLRHTGRTATWNGPLQNITSKVQNGKTYACSGWVRLDNTSSASITMTIKKVDGGGTTYTNISSRTGSNSSWSQLSGSYTLTVTGTLTELSIYFEGPGSGINYYVDDVSVQ